MKSVLIICAGSLATFAAAGNRPDPVDSLKISRDLSLDEVVVTATKVAKGTPVAYSEVSKDELSRKNDGQGIPYLHHDFGRRDRYRLFGFPYPRHRRQPHQHHGQRRTG